MSKCSKCGDTCPDGQQYCRPCRAAYQRAYRARNKATRQAAASQRLKRTTRTHTSNSSRLASTIRDPNQRFQFMLERHERTLTDLDAQRDLLDKLIKAAEEEGDLDDYKHWIKSRQDLMLRTSEYDLKMSKELQVWQEIAADQAADAKPIRFVCNTLHIADYIVPTPERPKT